MSVCVIGDEGDTQVSSRVPLSPAADVNSHRCASVIILFYQLVIHNLSFFLVFDVASCFNDYVTYRHL